jgi:ABC-type amino acid transport substrate-binding protein
MHDEDGRSPTVMLLALIGVAWLSFFSVAAAQTSVPPMPDPPSRLRQRTPSRRLVSVGFPYQYQDYKRGVPVLTGFDIEIERALARIMNVEIALPQIAWENHLAALAAGDADIAAGATESEARSRYAYFSKPYRTETDVLILPRGTSGRYPFRTIEEMLDTFAKAKVSARDRCRLRLCRPARERLHRRSGKQRPDFSCRERSAELAQSSGRDH